MNNDFDTAIQNWLTLLQSAMDKHCANHPLPPPKFSLDPGSKYVKVVRFDNSSSTSGSVYCFIDKSNGNILKAASYKAPEPKKIPRGNIYGDNPIEGCGPYGVMYLKGGSGFSF